MCLQTCKKYLAEEAKGQPVQQVFSGVFASDVGPSSDTTRKGLGFAFKNVSCQLEMYLYFKYY